MDKNVIYGFLAGLHLGRFTNFVSNITITGIVLYFLEPNFYSSENMNNIKQTVLKIMN